MKTKMLLTAALLGAATLSAKAGIHFGFSIGLPVPVVAVAPAAPVVVAAPVVAAPVYPAPVYAAPAYAPGYVWAPGYWSVCSYGRVWAPGCWHYRCGYAGWGHPCGWRH